MSAHAPIISLVELRRGVAVGDVAVELGIDQVPGVVLADVRYHESQRRWWMPVGHLHVRVWGGQGPRVWAAVQRSPQSQGRVVVLEVWPVTRWALVRAWWRWQQWRLARWLA